MKIFSFEKKVQSEDSQVEHPVYDEKTIALGALARFLDAETEKINSRLISMEEKAPSLDDPAEARERFIKIYGEHMGRLEEVNNVYKQIVNIIVNNPSYNQDPSEQDHYPKN